MSKKVTTKKVGRDAKTGRFVVKKGARKAVKKSVKKGPDGGEPQP